MIIIVWEGPDQSGKSTTSKLVEKRRNGKDTNIDRFIGSNIVYGIVNKRYSIHELHELYNDDCKFTHIFEPVLIYLYAPLEVLLERIKKDKHESIDIDILKECLHEYDEYYKTSHHKYKLKLNTNEYSQNEIVNIIINFLREIEYKKINISNVLEKKYLIL